MFENLDLGGALSGLANDAAAVKGAIDAMKGKGPAGPVSASPAAAGGNPAAQSGGVVAWVKKNVVLVSVGAGVLLLGAVLWITRRK